MWTSGTGRRLSLIHISEVVFLAVRRRHPGLHHFCAVERGFVLHRLPPARHAAQVTERMKAFREEVLDEKPYVDGERAVLATEAYKENLSLIHISGK